MARELRIHTVKLVATAVALSAASCSWTRFDDAQDNAPIVLLNRPDKLNSGFGVSLATATDEDRVRLLVGGVSHVSPAANFSLGTGSDPKLDSIGAGFCDQGNANNPCFLGKSIAGRGLSRVPGQVADGTREPLCFIVGIGAAQGTGSGLIGRCDDDTEYALPVPEEVDKKLIQPTLGGDKRDEVVISAGKNTVNAEGGSALIAGAGRLRLAWYYVADSLKPVSLVPGTVDESYGSTVAAFRVGKDTQLFAVGAPEKRQVWLFRAKAGNVADSLGCIGGLPSFGRSLAAGLVTPDDIDEDLVIADANNVHVFDGAKLAKLPATTSSACGLAGLPAGTLITSFDCGSDNNVSGCATSNFGATLEVGDLDGNGDGEVIVGAPGMTVRDVSGAGAVLIYDVDTNGTRPHSLSDIKFLSSAEGDDRLGASLAVPYIGDRNIIAAGAPGNGKVALFYCSSLPGFAGGGRCP